MDFKSFRLIDWYLIFADRPNFRPMYMQAFIFSYNPVQHGYNRIAAAFDRKLSKHASIDTDSPTVSTFVDGNYFYMTLRSQQAWSAVQIHSRVNFHWYAGSESHWAM
jgi:hypothetical protein